MRPTLSSFVVDSLETSGKSINQSLPEVLHAIRVHLGMDVAFVSEFSKGHRVFRFVDCAGERQPVVVGGSEPLEASYCQRVVDGRLPELITDAATFPAAMELAVTAALPVGAHLSIPVRLADGSIYGTFCCFSFTPDTTLTERDLALMRVFADLTAKQIDRALMASKEALEIERRIKSVLSSNELSIVYQPIYHLERNEIVGFESLSRFAAKPLRTPDIWFQEAAGVGLGIALEAKAVRVALQGLRRLPTEIYLSVNFSPEAILSGSIDRILGDAPLDRIVLEITEHHSIDHYTDIAKTLRPLRKKGLRIAVDDAGAGYASFRHILNLAPDIIKLDMSLTRDIDTDRSRRALAAALIRFSQETGCKIIAEGVETVAELNTLQQLGVVKAQGYLLGRPMSLDNALELLEQLGYSAHNANRAASANGVGRPRSGVRFKENAR